MSITPNEGTELLDTEEVKDNIIQVCKELREDINKQNL